MGWSSLTLVTDNDLGAIEPEATTVGTVRPPWGSATWPAARAEAKRELKIWIERDYAQIQGAADRVQDRWVLDEAFGYTGAAYTDLRIEAAGDDEDDLNLKTIFTTPASDCLYLGAAWEYEGLFVQMVNGQVNAASSVISVDYWNGGWKALTIGDRTKATTDLGVSFAKSGRVSWNMPIDWERRTLNGTSDELYWVRVSVDVALTAGTSASQIVAVRPPEGLKRVATYLGLHFILNGLAMGAANPDSWRERAVAYWDRAIELYGSLRDKGGIPMDLDTTGAIDSEDERVVRSPIRIFRA